MPLNYDSMNETRMKKFMHKYVYNTILSNKAQSCKRIDEIILKNKLNQWHNTYA